MVDIQTVSIVVASAGVFVAAVYYVLQIRHQNRMRQTDTLMRLYSTWGSKEYRDSMTRVNLLEFEDYQDFLRKYGPWQRDAPLMMAIWNISDFFEVMGVLVHRKLSDTGLIADMFPVVPAWEKIGPIQKERRKEFNMPMLFKWFEYLYNEIKKREQRLQAKKG